MFRRQTRLVCWWLRRLSQALSFDQLAGWTHGRLDAVGVNDRIRDQQQQDNNRPFHRRSLVSLEDYISR